MSRLSFESIAVTLKYLVAIDRAVHISGEVGDLVVMDVVGIDVGGTCIRN